MVRCESQLIQGRFLLTGLYDGEIEVRRVDVFENDMESNE